MTLESYFSSFLVIDLLCFFKRFSKINLGLFKRHKCDRNLIRVFQIIGHPPKVELLDEQLTFAISYKGLSILSVVCQTGSAFGFVVISATRA